LVYQSKNETEMGNIIIRADLHGAKVKVIRSQVSSFIGIEGIILQETSKTFNIITPDDVLKNITKKNSVFTFVIGKFLVTLHGKYFDKNSQSRSTHNWKNRENFDI
jgi:ribonuclease P protein subunit POP4